MIHDPNIEGVGIKGGEFVTYQTSELHLNPAIYTDPTKFDLQRYLPSRREDEKETFAHLD